MRELLILISQVVFNVFKLLFSGYVIYTLVTGDFDIVFKVCVGVCVFYIILSVIQFIFDLIYVLNFVDGKIPTTTGNLSDDEYTKYLLTSKVKKVDSDEILGNVTGYFIRYSEKLSGMETLIQVDNGKLYGEDEVTYIQEDK